MQMQCIDELEAATRYAVHELDSRHGWLRTLLSLVLLELIRIRSGPPDTPEIDRATRKPRAMDSTQKTNQADATQRAA